MRRSIPLAVALVRSFAAKWILLLLAVSLVISGMLLVVGYGGQTVVFPGEPFRWAVYVGGAYAIWASIVWPGSLERIINRSDSTPLALSDRDGELATAIALAIMATGCLLYALFLPVIALVAPTSTFTHWRTLTAMAVPLLPILAFASWRQTQSRIPIEWQPVIGIGIAVLIMVVQLAVSGVLASIPMPVWIATLLAPVIDFVTLAASFLWRLATARDFYESADPVLATRSLIGTVSAYVGLLALSPFVRGPRHKTAPRMMDREKPPSIGELLMRQKTRRESRPLAFAGAAGDAFRARLRRDEGRMTTWATQVAIVLGVVLILGGGVAIQIARSRGVAPNGLPRFLPMDFAIGSTFAAVVLMALGAVFVARTAGRIVATEQREDKIQLLTLAGISERYVYRTAIREAIPRFIIPAVAITILLGFARQHYEFLSSYGVAVDIAVLATLLLGGLYLAVASATEAAMTQTSLANEVIGVMLCFVPPLYLLMLPWRKRLAIRNLEAAAAGTLKRRASIG